MICTLSKHSAEEKGFDDALMLDYRGQIAEATGANIFFVMADGKLHTPLADCFLDGITRRTVIKLAKARGIEVIERKIMPDELPNASIFFLTGTAAEVTPVGEIDRYKYKVSKISHWMMDDYDKEVGKLAKTQHQQLNTLPLITNECSKAHFYIENEEKSMFFILFSSRALIYYQKLDSTFFLLAYPILSHQPSLSQH